jgi:hypothetical protein
VETHAFFRIRSRYLLCLWSGESDASRRVARIWLNCAMMDGRSWACGESLCAAAACASYRNQDQASFLDRDYRNRGTNHPESGAGHDDYIVQQVETHAFFRIRSGYLLCLWSGESDASRRVARIRLNYVMMDGRSWACGGSLCAAAARERPVIIRLMLHFWITVTIIGALTIQNLVLDTMII